MNLMDRSTRELLTLFGETLGELRRRNVIRSNNNPVADYAERIAADALGLTLVSRSTAGYDAIDTQGGRFEIKGRRRTPENRSTQLSAIRGLDKNHFDFLIGILFEDDFSVQRACLVPIHVVRLVSAYRAHVNAWVLHLRDSLWEVDGVKDVTAEIRKAAGQ